MFDVTILNTVAFFLVVLAVIYGGFSWQFGKLIQPNYKRLSYYISLFTLFGVVGEVFVNTLFKYLFSSGLWEYHLYPAHNGDISYFFFGIWGTLGFYTYFRDYFFRGRSNKNALYSGLILGSEAMLIEIFANGSFYYLFGNYIFYYFPTNLGYFSHFSCLEVVPCYIAVGYGTTRLIWQQEELQYRGFRTTLIFYWMIISSSR